MGERTAITWCDHTLNPWTGCFKISPGCDNCYAAESDHRWNPEDGHWEPTGPRQFRTEEYWKNPQKWARRARLAGERRRVFVASQAAARHMSDGGRIINIGSTNAQRMPFAGGAAYAMSKSALVGLVKGLARDLGPRGITVNNVSPGPVDTDMNPQAGDFAVALHGLMAIPRHGKADEIAGMVAYLAGPEAAFVTGADLLIDGGFAA